MPTQQSLDNLLRVVSGIKAIDRERLLRGTLGEESLQQAGFTETLERIVQRASFAAEYAPRVDEGTANNVTGVLEQLRAQMDAQSKHNNQNYVAQKQNFLNTISNSLQNLQAYWPPMVTAAIEARGFLDDEGIRKEYQRAVGDMKAQADEALKRVQEQSEKTIEEARKLAKDIEERARRTAAHISVEAAQEQFREAQKILNAEVKLWAWISVGAVGAFIGVAIYLAKIHLPPDMKWEVVYFAAIRITILTAVGAMATFCLRILRAHMHMSQQNLHRQRLANSMAAFVESAITPEQRDLILSQLVTSVAEFGTSGLLSKEDDSMYSPKMTIEAITRTLSSSK